MTMLGFAFMGVHSRVGRLIFPNRLLAQENAQAARIRTTGKPNTEVIKTLGQ